MIKVSGIGKDHENRFDGLMMWENLRGKVEAKPSVGGKQQPSDIKRLAMEIVQDEYNDDYDDDYNENYDDNEPALLSDQE